MEPFQHRYQNSPLPHKIPANQPISYRGARTGSWHLARLGHILRLEGSALTDACPRVPAQMQMRSLPSSTLGMACGEGRLSMSSASYFTHEETEAEQDPPLLMGAV